MNSRQNQINEEEELRLRRAFIHEISIVKNTKQKTEK
jgi:hypothetical protein